MNLKLSPRQEQKLAPQLIRSLSLLQLPKIELEQLVKQELDLNPLLEEVELTEQELDQDSPESSQEEGKELDYDLDEDAWTKYLDEVSDMQSGLGASFDPDEEDRRIEPPDEIHLHEHLLDQLRLVFSSEEDIRIGEYIIGNIDDSGYLVCTVEEIAESLEVTSEKVEKVLKAIQRFDPIGVASRDLRECLMVQLEEKGLQGSVAMEILKNHLKDLTRKRYKEICNSLRISEDEVRKAEEIISTLNPKPGNTSHSPTPRFIDPDMIVDKYGDEYVVTFNDWSVPSLRVSPFYRSILRDTSKVSDDTKNYLTEKLNSARWLINSINQRRTTMFRVMSYIVQAQRDFFENGISHLRPMKLQEVADSLGLHQSTISRVTNGKYVQTQHGVFELKFFFDNKVSSDSEKDLSSTSVMSRIRELIEAEEPKSPLSDQQIVDILREEGIDIARRTIAKYRDKMAINPARYRKKL